MEQWGKTEDKKVMRPPRGRVSAWRIRVLLAAVAVVLFAGNPGPRQFARMVVDKTAAQQTGDPNTFVINLFPSVARALVLANARRSNFYLFSIYRIHYGEHETATYLAALWSVVQIGSAQPEDRHSSKVARPTGPSSAI